MTIVGIWGLVVFLLALTVVPRGLIRGELPPRFPLPLIRRSDEPVAYWFFLGSFIASGVLGLAVAARFLI